MMSRQGSDTGEFADELAAEFHKLRCHGLRFLLWSGSSGWINRKDRIGSEDLQNGQKPQKLGFRVGEEDDGFSHVRIKRIYCVWALCLGLRPLTLDNGLEMVILRPRRLEACGIRFG